MNALYYVLADQSELPIHSDYINKGSVQCAFSCVCVKNYDIQRIDHTDNIHAVSLLYVILYVVADNYDLQMLYNTDYIHKIFPCMCSFIKMETKVLKCLYYIEYIHEVSIHYGIFYVLETSGTCKGFIGH